MRTTIPLIISFVIGMFMLGEYFVPHWRYQAVKDTILDFGIVIAAAAFLLGIINLCQVNIPKITHRDKDWGYKALMLGSMVITLGFGIYEGPDRMEDSVCQTKSTVHSQPLNIITGTNDQLKIRLHFTPSERQILTNSKQTIPEAVVDKLQLIPDQLLLSAGAVTPNGFQYVTCSGCQASDKAPSIDLHLTLPKATREVADMAAFIQDEFLAKHPINSVQLLEISNQNSRLRFRAKNTQITKISILDGSANATLGFTMQQVATPYKNLYKWIFDRIYIPLVATMFSLLAFYIASAAFRAFRARNLDATILLVSACIVMLAQVPVGEQIPLIGEYLSQFKQWLITVPNVAARRAIFIGAALGAITTGLRIVLGIERSHLGGD